MDGRMAALEQRLASVEALVDDLRRQVTRLTEPTPAGAPTAVAVAAPADVQIAGTQRPDLVAVLGLFGRFLLAMGGAFLLRAVTGSGAVAPATGVGLGLVYAGLWVATAYRSTAAVPLAGTFHAAAAAAIGFPLIWEATTRFRVFAPWTAAGAIALVSGVALWVAWRRRRQGIAWVVTLAACAVCVALVASTGQVVPFATVLIGLGTGTLWMGYALDWVALRWPVAVVANVVVSALTVRAFSSAGGDTAGVTLAVQGFLVVAYLGSVGIRTLVKGRNVVPFEVAQTAAVLVVGVAGAVAVALRTGAEAWGVGVLSVLIGAAAYATGLRFMGRKPVLIRNVYYYTSLALVFLLAGTALVWPGAGSARVWLALAVGAAWWWHRSGRLVLLIHAAIYLAAAAVGTGAIGYGTAMLLASAPGHWDAPSWGRAALLLASAMAAVVVARAPAAHGAQRLPRAAINLTLLWTASALAVGAAAPLVAGHVPEVGDAGAVAALRTSVLSAAALAAAVAGRRPNGREWAWFVYPVLILVGLRLLALDLAVSAPVHLFVALAAYGTALILAPRLKGRPPGVAAAS